LTTTAIGRNDPLLDVLTGRKQSMQWMDVGRSTLNRMDLGAQEA